MAIRRPARLVAPLVLLVSVAAVLLVVQNTLSDDGSTTAPAATSTATTRTTAAKGPKTYRVRSGDTLGAIAEKVDVSVDRLVQLNPDVDPQSLRAGQRLRLRE
ncbi:MAG: LysM domain [Solirubrobacteraceae bacterium]|jgi:LysM repeat protein|nr:LysM domain [Solirubrobacteraceae bacterium]